MNFPEGLGEKAIKDVVQTHPEVGTVLQKYDIGCVTCSVGICLLKDVVQIHGLSKDTEERIETEINEQLRGRNPGRKED